MLILILGKYFDYVNFQNGLALFDPRLVTVSSWARKVKRGNDKNYLIVSVDYMIEAYNRVRTR